PPRGLRSFPTRRSSDLESVDAALLAEWKISRPDLPASSERAIHDNAKKAWRFVGEMEEIARALTAVGLPPAFHEAAREIFARLSDRKSTRPELQSLAYL